MNNLIKQYQQVYKIIKEETFYFYILIIISISIMCHHKRFCIHGFWTGGFLVTDDLLTGHLKSKGYGLIFL